MRESYEVRELATIFTWPNARKGCGCGFTPATKTAPRTRRTCRRMPSRQKRSRHGTATGVCPNDRSDPWLTFVSLDITHPASENAVMQVTLTSDLEKFVTDKVRVGGYVNRSEVVREALRNFRAKDDPAENDSQELAELLLPAVRS